MSNGPDTITMTLNKTKAVWSTVSAVGGGLAIILVGVNALVDYRFDKKVEEAAKNPRSVLNMTIENLVEEELGEFVETVVSDDIDHLQREIDRLERRVERMEGQ